MSDEQPKKRRGRPPKNAQAAPSDANGAKRRGRPPNGLKGSYAALLSQMRVERDRLIDKVTALGTAIEALEAVT